MTTLLTEGVEFMSAEERIEKERAYEKGRVIAWQVWFEAYANGQLSLGGLLKKSQDSLIALKVEDFQRWKTLGELTDRALGIVPPKRSRGNKGQPKVLRSLASKLVDAASGDGYVVNRAAASGETAFERVADILKHLGIKVSARQVEDWHYQKELPE